MLFLNFIERECMDSSKPAYDDTYRTYACDWISGNGGEFLDGIGIVHICWLHRPCMLICIFKHLSKMGHTT